MHVLVTGGAGYIGSHAARQLLAAGHRVTIVDSLRRGHRAAICPGANFHELALASTTALTGVMQGVDAVLHFAALALVGESVEQPELYHRNNVQGTVSLLSAMQQAGVHRMVFSSTCAVYGTPEQAPVDETAPLQPESPYGQSKLDAERELARHAAKHPEFSFTALRYFNVAGCSGEGSLGEDHQPETHLIPILLQVALGQREQVTLFGQDYPTPDGTCIRDYIHVDDLCAAHLLALETQQPGECRQFNLGIGRGYSVREVLEAARQVTGHPIPAVDGPRRPGDPAALFADPSKIQRELGWQPAYTQIESIIETAWNWFQAHPHGYGGMTARRGQLPFSEKLG